MAISRVEPCSQLSSSFPLAFRQDSARELFTASESGETVHWNTPLTSLACKSFKDGFDMDNMCGSSCADCFNMFQILILHCLGSNELKILHLSHRTRKTFLTLTFVMASRLDFLERWMARQKSTNSNGIQFARVKDVTLQDWCVYI